MQRFHYECSSIQPCSLSVYLLLRHRPKTECQCGRDFSDPWCGTPRTKQAQTQVEVLNCSDDEHVYCLNGGTCKPDWRDQPETPCFCPPNYAGTSCTFPAFIFDDTILVELKKADSGNLSRPGLLVGLVIIATSIVAVACLLQQRARRRRAAEGDGIVQNIQSFRDEVNEHVHVEEPGQSANGNMLFPAGDGFSPTYSAPFSDNRRRYSHEARLSFD